MLNIKELIARSKPTPQIAPEEESYTLGGMEEPTKRIAVPLLLERIAMSQELELPTWPEEGPTAQELELLDALENFRQKKLKKYREMLAEEGIF